MRSKPSVEFFQQRADRGQSFIDNLTRHALESIRGTFRASRAFLASSSFLSAAREGLLNYFEFFFPIRHARELKRGFEGNNGGLQVG